MSNAGIRSLPPRWLSSLHLYKEVEIINAELLEGALRSSGGYDLL